MAATVVSLTSVKALVIVSEPLPFITRASAGLAAKFVSVSAMVVAPAPSPVSVKPARLRVPPVKTIVPALAWSVVGPVRVWSPKTVRTPRPFMTRAAGSSCNWAMLSWMLTLPARRRPACGR